MPKEKIGIYGGSFSPIHEGHVRAALAFLDAMKLDRLLIIPTGNPPHKTVEGASAEERFEMTRLAFCETPAYKSGKLSVSDYEMTREGKSYTVYTLEHFSSPDRELYMLVGTDMFLSLHRWYRAQDIFRLTNIALMRRENEDANTAAIAEKKRDYTERFGARIFELDEPVTEISSTELRRRISDGSEREELIPSVVEIISTKRIYTGNKGNDNG